MHPYRPRFALPDKNDKYKYFWKKVNSAKKKVFVSTKIIIRLILLWQSFPINACNSNSEGMSWPP
jgi:hypothetical protein